MLQFNSYDDYKIVKKVWGTEVWIVNNEQYCCKRLIIEPGFMCSLHCHPIKRETFYIEKGRVMLLLKQTPESETQLVMLSCGDSITINPGVIHRFRSASAGEKAVVLEISTTHSDEDVVRYEESRKIG